MITSRIQFLALVLVLAAVTAFSSCAAPGIPGIAEMAPLPPAAQALFEVTERITPRYQKFKIAVLTFVDQTGKGVLVVDSIADMLTTELFAGGRFELYDRGDLVQETADAGRAMEVVKSPDGGGDKTVTTTTVRTTSTARSQKTAHQKAKVQNMVDGILLGYITSYKIHETIAEPETKKGKRGKTSAAEPSGAPIKGELHCDFRIVNSWLTEKKIGEGLSELVVYSGSAKIGFTTDASRSSVTLDREDIRAIAAQIKDKFTDFSSSNIRITAIDGRTITLDVGRQDMVKQGFTGYIVEKNERTHVLHYLAEFAVINVFDTASTAYVISADKFLRNLKIKAKAVIK